MEMTDLPVDENLTDSLVQFIKENGSNSLEQFTDKQLNQWRNCTLNLAITGNSGVGKSTFINTIRSLRAYDTGGAAVNVIECTQNPTCYPHPENENLNLWDLPGVGTTRFPRATYLRDMNFQQYDFFLIVTKTRFTENDAWLAKEIYRMNKGFFFLRTQIDVDIQNARDEQSHSFNEDILLSRIRNDCLENLQDISPAIYLISGLLNHNSRWDFPRLITDLISNFPLIKRQAFILAMCPLGQDLIHAKTVELKKRIWLVAAASATVAVIPVPFISLGFDLSACIRETEIYRQQLGLTEPALRQLSNQHQIPYDKFLAVLNDRIPIQIISDIGNFVLSSARSMLSSVGAQETSRFIPILGTAIVSAASFGSTMYILNKTLNDMEQAALQIQKIILDCSTNFD